MNFFDMKCDIPELIGDNYKVWNEKILLHLSWVDIDYAIRKNELAPITETSKPDEVDLYKKWERSNRLSMMFIKTKISANIRGNVLCTLHIDDNVGIKRCVVKEDSSILWHRRLGCIKGKQANVSKTGAKRCSNLLEIMHTDICCLMDSYSQRYFIIFIDDYSRYMCIYFLEHKAKALNAFKIFKVEVEKQYDKQIKIVRSDRGGEYFGRYAKGGQTPGPLAKFLVEQVDPVVPHIPENIEQLVDQQAPPENVDATLRRSTWIKRSTISSDYMVYLQESEFIIGAKNDPETFSQAMESRESNLWYAAMKEEINSMAFNEV
ncbi:UNVERIFIED_CONTAM: hypothetical protein Scaly_1637500 [Sesamum calycinum]|uniref:Integrase catalytic domain-containing protein n=1 Tax=Sesamum calycinum TaxID=2727403 RepID=A0AAW2PB50_9LAMI